MKNISPIYLVLIAILAVGALFYVNIGSKINSEESHRYLSPNLVEGIDVEHNGLLYPLNFKQQLELIAILNRCSPADLDILLQSSETVFGYQRLLIRQFTGKQIEIIPVGLVDGRLLFRAEVWNPGGLILESAPPRASQLLNETFDP